MGKGPPPGCERDERGKLLPRKGRGLTDEQEPELVVMRRVDSTGPSADRSHQQKNMRKFMEKTPVQFYARKAELEREERQKVTDTGVSVAVLAEDRGGEAGVVLREKIRERLKGGGDDGTGAGAAGDSPALESGAAPGALGG